MSGKLKIHFIGLCEICAVAVQRLVLENERDSKDAPSASAIGKHLLGSERAVYKEFEPVIDGIANALRDDCADWPKTEKKTPAREAEPEPEKQKPEPEKPEAKKPEPKKSEKPAETKSAETKSAKGKSTGTKRAAPAASTASSKTKKK